MTIHTSYEEVDMLQGRKHTVLLIEADKSLRRLITLGLQYRGMHVIEASSPTRIPALSSQPPAVVVLDIDGEVGSNYTLLSTFQSHPYFSTIPLVVLAWDCLVTGDNHQDSSQTSITCLAKPFDARTLHTTIEQIQDTGKGSNSASRQELLLAKHSVTPTPSIWPLITAAGLVLSLIGLMTQITISALGLLVILIALLWWTLGTKTEPESLAV
jgi:DNA-binding NtrC family response regulator